jgi:hypothetical protein
MECVYFYNSQLGIALENLKKFDNNQSQIEPTLLDAFRGRMRILGAEFPLYFQ